LAVSDNFATFLKTIQREREAGHGRPVLKLLSVLSETGPETIPALLEKTELPPTGFIEAYNEAIRAAVVEVETDADGQQRLRLTEAGRLLTSSNVV
jgi:hypothetical protein